MLSAVVDDHLGKRTQVQDKTKRGYLATCNCELIVFNPTCGSYISNNRNRSILLILTTWLHCSQAEALDCMIEKLKVIYFAKYGFAFPLSGEKFGHLSVPFK